MPLCAGHQGKDAAAQQTGQRQQLPDRQILRGGFDKTVGQGETRHCRNHQGNAAQVGFGVGHFLIGTP